MNSLLRGVAIGGIFLLPFIPLLVSRTMFFPFITGKNFSFRIITEIMLASWLILALWDARYRPRLSWVTLSVVGFLTVITVADIFGVNPTKSFWSNFERMEGLITLLHLGAYFLVASSVMKSEVLWRRLFHTSLAVSAIIGVYGVLQLSGAITINQGGVRLDATLGNAIYFAFYMFFHFFVAGYYLLRNVSEKGSVSVRYVYGALMALHLFVLFHATSRGVTLGLVLSVLIGTGLIALFEKERAKRVWRMSAVGVLLGVVLLGAVFVNIRHAEFVRNSPVLGRFAGISLEEGSSRFMIWRMAIEGFKERPLLGYGQGNFDVVFNKHYNPLMYSQEAWFDRAHNIVFDWLIAGGVFGLLSYLALFASTLFLLWRDKAHLFSVTEKALFTAFLVGYFFQNLFVFDNITSYIIFFTFLAYIHAREEEDGRGKGARESIARVSAYTQGLVRTARRALLGGAEYVGGQEVLKRFVLPGLVLVGLAGGILLLNVPGIRTNRTLIKALIGHPDGAMATINLFEKAASFGELGRTEVREQLIQTSLRIHGSSIPRDVQERAHTLAESEFTSLVAGPYGASARYPFFLGTYYRRIGRYDEALIQLTRAQELSPDKQLIAFERGIVHLLTGKVDESVAIYKKTYEDAPEYDDARTLYAVASIFAKDDATVDMLVGTSTEALARADERVIRSYIDMRRADKVLDLLEARATHNPAQRQSILENVDQLVAQFPEVKAEGERVKVVIQALREEAGGE